MSSSSPPDRWSSQRYEPLPGLLGLPRFVWRRIPRSGQIAAIVMGIALVVGTVIAVPFIASGKREGATRERRADASARARELRRVRADQAPHRGSAPNAPSAPAAARRAAIVGAIESGVTADARGRYRAGRLPGPPVKRTTCRSDSPQLASLQPSARQAGGAVLGCLAATTVSTAPGGARFAIGFEFLVAVDWRRGTFTWCKTNPAPGEGFGGSRPVDVRLARACLDPDS